MVYTLVSFLCIHILSQFVNGETIDCTGSQACWQYNDIAAGAGMPLTCSGNESCTVICDGSTSCQFAYITCPAMQECTVRCNYVGACSYAVIRADSSTSLSVECNVGCQGSFGLSRIYCPIRGSCNILIEDTAYDGSGLQSASAPMNHLQIYSANAWNELSITCIPSVNECYSSTYDGGAAIPLLYCTKSYSSSCYMQRLALASWRCSNANADLCNSYTFDPSVAPTQPPTQSPTQPPSYSPTIAPSQSPTIRTNTPTTNMPTLAPSSSPSFPPTSAPSEPPTMTPSYSPTAAPTKMPTFAPSRAPSDAPTIIPSQAPTYAPTQYPTYVPSDAPTLTPSGSPSQPPSIAPSVSPTVSPTMSPTKSPTNFPTKSDAYTETMQFVYTFSKLTEKNKAKVENETASSLVSIIEKGYVDIAKEYDDVFNDTQSPELQYRYFQIISENEQFEHLEDEYYNFLMRTQVNYQEESVKRLISFVNGKVAFIRMITSQLIEYFDNNDVEFSVESYTPPASQSFDWLFPILLIFMGVMTAISFIAFIFNKMPSTKVDNAIWSVMMIFGLQIVDFVSDINLCVEMLLRLDGSNRVEHVSFLYIASIGSVVFIVIPYITNIVLATNIKRMVSGNSAAITYFEQKSNLFVLLVVISGSCYPVLVLLSSRIFALEIMNCGLTAFELQKLTTLKIFGSVLIENCPQLICQVLYIIYLRGASKNTILSLVSSFLSIVAAVLAYFVSRKSSDCQPIFYDLLIVKDGKTLNADEKKQIKQKKECKDSLKNVLCSALQIQKNELELGYVTSNEKGFVIRIVHYLMKTEIQSLNDNTSEHDIDGNTAPQTTLCDQATPSFDEKMQELQILFDSKLDKILHSVQRLQERVNDLESKLVEENQDQYNINMAQQFVSKLYSTKNNAVKSAFKQHFELDKNTAFTVKYYARYDYLNLLRNKSVHRLQQEIELQQSRNDGTHESDEGDKKESESDNENERMLHRKETQSIS